MLFQKRAEVSRRPLETEFYEVPQATVNRMTGGSGGGMGGAAADPLHLQVVAEEMMKFRQRSKHFFRVGITFDEDEGSYFNSMDFR